MGQRDRDDHPGCWHHLFNRGVARRAIFETLDDVRYFLSRLARVHRRGLLEVHAYCLMLTHFHLLVRSPTGEVGRAMQAVTNPFSRWFNRRRRRDGPLFRGRFRSRPVESERYWWTLVRYIDFNPVKAGIVTDPRQFVHGSASRYAHPGPWPRWLSRNRVEEAVAGSVSEGEFTPEGYVRLFGIPPTDGEIEIVERRLRFPHQAADPLDDLLAAAPASVRDWQQRKCALADGTQPGLPIVTPATVLDLVGLGDEPGNASMQEQSLLLATGLMRDACGLAYGEIARRLGCSTSSAHRWAETHAGCVLEGGDYAESSAIVLQRALKADHPAVRV